MIEVLSDIRIVILLIIAFLIIVFFVLFFLKKGKAEMKTKFFDLDFSKNNTKINENELNNKEHLNERIVAYDALKVNLRKEFRFIYKVLQSQRKSSAMEKIESGIDEICNKLYNIVKINIDKEIKKLKKEKKENSVITQLKMQIGTHRYRFLVFNVLFDLFKKEFHKLMDVGDYGKKNEHEIHYIICQLFFLSYNTLNNNYTLENPDSKTIHKWHMDEFSNGIDKDFLQLTDVEIKRHKIYQVAKEYIDLSILEWNKVENKIKEVWKIIREKENQIKELID